LEQFLFERYLDQSLWKAFVEGHFQGNIFHTPEMFEVFNHTRGHKPTLWAAMGTDREVLALLLPVQITLFNGPLRSFTSRAVAYGSVLCASNQRGRTALGELLKVYNREEKSRLLFTEFRNLSDLQDCLPILDENGFIYEDHLNFLINLNRPLPEIWKEVRSNARRNIKKAQSVGVHIEELCDFEDIPSAYDVLKKVYSRIQVPLPDISLFQSAFKILGAMGMFKILLARLEDKTIGVLCLMLYKGVVYYWYTGTLREYASFRAGDLLVWHSLELGNRNDFHLFDFGGGGKPDEPYGVRDFKAKFGGTLVNYGRNICVHGPTKLKISKASYHLMRRFL
jgi:serine/alanine adding enzyme